MSAIKLSTNDMNFLKKYVSELFSDLKKNFSKAEVFILKFTYFYKRCEII